MKVGKEIRLYCADSTVLFHPTQQSSLIEFDLQILFIHRFLIYQFLKISRVHDRFSATCTSVRLFTHMDLKIMKILILHDSFLFRNYQTFSRHIYLISK